MRRIPWFVVGLAGLCLIGTEGRNQSLPAGASDALQPLKSSSVKLEAGFGKIPLYFVANKGQMDKRVDYYVQGKDKSIYFSPGGVTIVLASPAERWVVKLEFVGADRHVRPLGQDETGAVISYFKGNPENWHTGLPTYSRLVYRNLWPGIDLVYSGTVDKLKYEFVVQPGADTSRIKLACRGASKVVLDEGGRLEIRTPLGNLHDDEPVAYQEVDGKRVDIPMDFTLEERSSEETAPEGPDQEPYSRSCAFSFEVGEYDRSLPLIMDPAVLVYCGYIGGSSQDGGNSIAVDGSGNAYVTGFTGSTSGTFPETVGPDFTHNSGDDAFVAKINASGTSLVYCGYIGGSGDDVGRGIAVDGSGNAYVTGETQSTQAMFPETVGPDLTHNGGTYDAFVAKVNSSGTSLVYCGYIGGSNNDYGFGIAVGGSGNAYVTGRTYSTETTFPETVGPDLTHNGSWDAFIAKVNAAGTGLTYCGYIGGSDWDDGLGIALDESGNAYVAGHTGSTAATFPEAVGPDLTHNGGTYDAYVAKVNASGTGLVYCGYIGGSETDYGQSIAVAGSGTAYVTGFTRSMEATFPDTVGPDLTHNGGSDAFVAKVNASGTSLVYCGYIGGSGDDWGYGIALDGSGNAYVIGQTSSTEATFPETGGPDLTYNGGTSDAYVAKVDSSGTGLVSCGYIGGSGGDYGYGIALDGSGNTYVIGRTSSSEATFPETVGPDLTFNAGMADAYVAKIKISGKDDFVGTWANGVYYRNSDTGAWVRLESSPATQIAVGDLDGDGFDDLIGAWPGQPGVWVKYSDDGTWAKLDNFTPDSIAAGDVNGDGREDFLGSWSAFGVFYRNSLNGVWVKLEGSPALQIAAGDLDGDGKDDLIGIWSADPGVWVKYSGSGLWAMLDSAKPGFIAAGDMSGDGRDDLLGSWSGSGVYYKNSACGFWVLLEASVAAKVGTGDLDGDRKGDLLGTWTSQPGAWVKYSCSGAWAKLDPTTPTWFAAGQMRSAAFSGSGSSSIAGAIAEPPHSFSGYADLSSLGPGGSEFVLRMDRNRRVGSAIDKAKQRRMTPGPGEPGFRPVREKNPSARKNRNRGK